MAKLTQRITPFLWFDDRAEEAARYYVSIFPNSTVVSTTRYDEATARAASRPAGSAMTVAFELDGQGFVALNGGPVFPFTEAVSFAVNCDTQAEIDHFGPGSPPAARRCSAGGSRTSSVCRGRSCLARSSG